MGRTDSTLPHPDLQFRTVFTPDFRAVVEQAVEAASGGQTLLTITTPVNGIDPLAALEIVGKSAAFRFYWEHPDQQFAISAGEALIRIGTQNIDRYRTIGSKIAHWKSRTFSHGTITHSLNGPHVLGGFAFHDQPQTHHWRNFGNAGFVIPEWMVVRDGQLTLLTLAGLVRSTDTADRVEGLFMSRFAELMRLLETMPDGQAASGSGDAAFEDEDVAWDEGRDSFRRNVSLATDRIRRGDFQKVVIAREVRIGLRRPLRITHMLHHLRTHDPTCRIFLFQLNRNAAFMGASPERLASFERAVVLTEGLAGTSPRGRTAIEDAHLEKALLQSAKDLNEHRFVVDAIADRLGQYTESVRYPAHPAIRKYRNVQHLYTPVSAELPEDTSPLVILDALHPTPAVGGHPAPAALRHLQELEQFDRGWFASPVGWLNLNGRGEFCVAIRSGLIEPGRVRLFAGCGIVNGSEPDTEWSETQLKLLPMRTALRHG